jgi:uncharacterized protein
VGSNTKGDSRRKLDFQVLRYDDVFMSPEALKLDLDDGTSVSALWMLPEGATAAYVFAHGAGAGMEHSFMHALASALAERSVATLRFNFPSRERKLARPDSPAVAQATVVKAVGAAVAMAPRLPLFAGGKSFGGRMTSQAQAEAPLASVRGLVFVGFPLHPAGKPGDSRAAHLVEVRVPMLFLQGTRDDLADLELLKPVVTKLGSRARLSLVEDADHSFHVRASSGRKDAAVIVELADVASAWMLKLAK